VLDEPLTVPNDARPAVGRLPTAPVPATGDPAGTPPDHAALLARDPEAWAQLYQQCFRGLHALASRRLPGGAAEDAVSETLARALVGIGRFDPDSGSVSAWLYGILRNVVLEQRRRSARDATPPAAPLPAPEPGPLQQLLAAERDAQLREAFDGLSPADRELLELRVVGGLSTSELAAALGRREGAVRMAQSRALARLRRRWEEATGD